MLSSNEIIEGLTMHLQKPIPGRRWEQESKVNKKYHYVTKRRELKIKTGPKNSSNAQRRFNYNLLMVQAVDIQEKKIQE